MRCHPGAAVCWVLPGVQEWTWERVSAPGWVSPLPMPRVHVLTGVLDPDQGLLSGGEPGFEPGRVDGDVYVVANGVLVLAEDVPGCGRGWDAGCLERRDKPAW
ncbi:MAG: hypothetical protein ACRDPW_09005 [Mycobacteriales bacterium]